MCLVIAELARIKFGSKKIVPDISPAKTKEGFIGGFVASILFGIIWVSIFIVPGYSFEYLVVQTNQFIFYFMVWNDISIFINMFLDY